MTKIPAVTNYVTRQDLRKELNNLEKSIGNMVSDVVSGAVAEILNVLGGQFMAIQDQMGNMQSDITVLKDDVSYLKIRVENINRKLDATISHLDAVSLKADRHDKILRRLHSKLA